MIMLSLEMRLCQKSLGFSECLLEPVKSCKIFLKNSPKKLFDLQASVLLIECFKHGQGKE